MNLAEVLNATGTIGPDVPVIRMSLPLRKDWDARAAAEEHERYLAKKAASSLAYYHRNKKKLLEDARRQRERSGEGTPRTSA